ncbi:MAG: cation:proton antiporter [Thermoplasmatota archaeon]
MAGGPEPILLSILIIILGAKLGGEFAERFKQPAVLGELLVGVILGASLLGGFIGMPDFALQGEHHHEQELLHDAEHDVELAMHGEGNLTMAEANLTAAQQHFGKFIGENEANIGALEILGALATIGVILLLFEVGLESDIKELTKVGVSSLLVGIIGIVGSFVLGFGFSYFLSEIWSSWAAANALIPNNLLHIFVGATLTATSVGITARVLGDMGRLNTKETRIILGAAVIDDIGGLIILAIVGAMVTATLEGGTVEATQILLIAGKAIGFLVVSLLVGLKFIPKLYDGAVEKFKVAGFPVALAITFALLMSYLATVAGLADIVGAFAGGLILAQTKAAHKIFEDLRPIAAIFVSFFFVTLGMKVDLRDLGDNVPLLLAASLALIVLAMAAKLACGYGVTKGTKASKLVVGVGMSPRGEVGLIFASLGLSLGVIAGWQYTMVIIVVMGTTFITPIWLKKLQNRFIGIEDKENPKAENASKILEA